MAMQKGKMKKKGMARGGMMKKRVWLKVELKCLWSKKVGR